jgi:predicted nuclease with TOPRIM domain
MIDKTENLVLEHLRAIRGDVGDIKDRLTQVELNTAMLGQQLGALTTAVYGAKSETHDLRRRIERIEQRLDLSDH